jgi:hypothetical protein
VSGFTWQRLDIETVPPRHQKGMEIMALTTTPAYAVKYRVGDGAQEEIQIDEVNTFAHAAWDAAIALMNTLPEEQRDKLEFLDVVRIR